MQIEITTEYLRSQGLSENFPTRFWSRVTKSDACWIWTGCLDDVGYGSMRSGGRGGFAVRSHRASWILNRGPIPKGSHVLHNCPNGDNKRCVNPAHLYLGTSIENGRDRAIKGQSSGKGGTPSHKLDWVKVHVIRSSTLSRSELATMFGVTRPTIHKIINCKIWKPIMD